MEKILKFLPILLLLLITTLVRFDHVFINSISQIGLSSWNVVIALWVVVAIILIPTIIQHRSKISRTVGQLSMPALPKVLWKFGILVIMEVLIILTICKYEHISGNALWAWTKNWWPALILIQIIISRLTLFRKSSGHGGHVSGISIVRVLPAYMFAVATLIVCIGFGHWLFNLNDHSDQVVTTPPIRFNPDLWMGPGIKTNTVAAGEHSEIISFCLNTKVIRSGPALLQKGKMDGGKVVWSDQPLRWVNKDENVLFYQNEVGRYYASPTNSLVCVITRTQ